MKNNLTVNDIVKLYYSNNLYFAENTPNNSADYGDGWEDVEDFHVLDDLIDLILYLNENKNLLDNEKEIFIKNRKNKYPLLAKLMEIVNNDVSIIETKNDGKSIFVLNGSIDMMTSYEIEMIYQEFLKEEINAKNNLKTL